MHLSEEQVERFLHGEVGTGDRLAAQHATSCPECRVRIDAARRERDDVVALLETLDEPAPRPNVATIAARGTAERSGRLLRWAAGILLAVGIAGAAYAMPGSPLPRWIAGMFAWVHWGAGGPPSLPRGENGGEARGGIAVAPGENLIVRFSTSQAGGFVRVTLTDGGEVTVRAPIDAATYTFDADRIEVANRGGPVTFEIEIPRGAARVEIQVGDRTIFLKDGPRVSASGPGGPGAAYVLSLEAQSP